MTEPPTDHAELRARVQHAVVHLGLERLGDALEPEDRGRLASACAPALSPERHGDLERFWTRFESIAATPVVDCDLAAPSIRVGRAAGLTPAQRRVLRDGLLELSPWRKGPFDIFGIQLDSEWRSDWKWARIAAAASWSGRRVLDVGCGNGYYALRALGAGARAVVGVDPALLYVVQFALLASWIRPAAAVLPLRLEELPPLSPFDVVLSLGVLGHRRDPLQHLRQLRQRVAPDGQLVLETLIVEQPGIDLLEPRGRYAAMRNVWQLPSSNRLCDWVKQAGWSEVQVVDVTATTSEEQRRTEWMPSQSLADFLDPRDPSRTREGHPAPLRAVVIARPG